MATKVIVAIHGIGEQTEYATAQSVVSQLCGYKGVSMNVPLGRFHSSDLAPVLRMSKPPDDGKLADLAFAEVYWASVPRQVTTNGFQLEDTKTWGRTISNRLAHRAALSGDPIPRRERIRLVTVLDEMIETVRILERANFIASRAGLFSFNLAGLMRDFVGDVQVVADFPARRDEILTCFDAAMAKVMTLGKKPGDVELYFVAHSEGTVVAFLAILRALADPDAHKWIGSVRGLMTIGSPIETHHLFWPELWEKLKPTADKSIKIPWRNYLDHGDPIAYELKLTRDWLTDSGMAKHFEFEEMAFSRSYLPGKAHNDYWTDEAVFGHFLDNVIFKAQPKLPTDRKPPILRTLHTAQAVSYALPYLLVTSLLFIATYLLYRPVLNAMLSDPHPSRSKMFEDVAGIGLLLLGMTVASRLPRLTAKKFWWLIGAGALATSMAAYSNFVSDETRRALGDAFSNVHWLSVFGDPHTVGVLMVAGGIAILGAFFGSWFPRGSVRLLPALGLACAAGLVLQLLRSADTRVEVWPIVLGGAAFFYLWWLAALLFDLVFVWHRYIRHSVAVNEAAGLIKRGYEATVVEQHVPASLVGQPVTAPKKANKPNKPTREEKPR